jgi:hypothetical protein
VPIIYWRDPGGIAAWDRPKINNIAMPGTPVRVLKPKLKLRLQTTKASGSDGGGVVSKGLDLEPFQIQMTIDHKADFDALAQIMPLLIPRKNVKARDAQLRIDHPVLAMLGVYWCVADEIEPDPPNNGGPMVVTCRFMAVSPPKGGVTSKPEQAVLYNPTIIGTQPQPTDIRGRVPAPKPLR